MGTSGRSSSLQKENQGLHRMNEIDYIFPFGSKAICRDFSITLWCYQQSFTYPEAIGFGPGASLLSLSKGTFKAASVFQRYLDVLVTGH